MKLLAWGSSDTGRKRDHNEDSFLVDDEVGLFAVADGMGGHQGGEAASRLALDVLRREIASASGDLEAAAARLSARNGERRFRRTAPLMALPSERSGVAMEDPTDPDVMATEDTLADATTEQVSHVINPAAAVVIRAAAREAGFAIFDTALAEPTLRGMGTTLTAMLYDAGRMNLVHAGDSRAYLFRDGSIEQLTEDHSWIAEQIRLGAMTEDEAKTSKFRHIITRSVGFERNVDLDSRGVPVEPGDCFLLCSDGMSNYVDNDELGRILRNTWYRRVPGLLIDLANNRGGDDNITVVVVYAANDKS